MQEQRIDGSSVLSTIAQNELINAEMSNAFMLAIRDPMNRSVALHKPGSIVELKGGARYEVQKNGSWRRVS